MNNETFRISVDKTEIKINGVWYNKREIVKSIQLYEDTFKRIMNEHSRYEVTLERRYEKYGEMLTETSTIEVDDFKLSCMELVGWKLIKSYKGVIK